MKKNIWSSRILFRGGISKVGDEQFVFTKKIVGHSPWATQKLQKKISTIENLFKLTQNITDTMHVQIIQKK
jgi:hypothetical protein